MSTRLDQHGDLKINLAIGKLGRYTRNYAADVIAADHLSSTALSIPRRSRSSGRLSMMLGIDVGEPTGSDNPVGLGGAYSISGGTR
jgi:hypothetical protein